MRSRWPNTYVQTPKMYAFVFPHKKSTQLLFDIVNIVLYIVIKQEYECIFIMNENWHWTSTVK